MTYLLVVMIYLIVILAHYLALYEMLEYIVRRSIDNEDYKGSKMYATMMLFTVVYMIFTIVFEYFYMVTIGIWLLWRLYNNVVMKRPSL